MNGFWLFQFIINLLIPIIMLFFGYWFRHHVPKKINCFYGYRTIRSMKNRDTWEFAHHYCAKYFRVAGWITLILSAAAMGALYAQSMDFIGICIVILCTLQCAVICVSIAVTESALKRTFDDNGNRLP